MHLCGTCTGIVIGYNGQTTRTDDIRDKKVCTCQQPHYIIDDTGFGPDLLQYRGFTRVELDEMIAAHHMAHTQDIVTTYAYLRSSNASALKACEEYKHLVLRLMAGLDEDTRASVQETLLQIEKILQFSVLACYRGRGDAEKHARREGA